MKRATEIRSRWNGFAESVSLGMQFGHDTPGDQIR
jgi:hypothetical protein